MTNNFTTRNSCKSKTESTIEETGKHYKKFPEGKTMR